MINAVHVPMSRVSDQGAALSRTRFASVCQARKPSMRMRLKTLGLGIFAAVLLFAHPAVGETFVDRAGITWEYELIGRNATLTAIAEQDAFDYITIPSKVDGYTVVALGASLFEGCTEITGVSIPYGVREIGDYAFWDCASLEEVTLPYGVSTLGDQVFFNCVGLSEMTLPATLEKIGLAAFGNTSIAKFKVDTQNQFYVVKGDLLCDKSGKTVVACPNALKATVVTVPSGVEEIGNGAFYGCSQLSRVSLPATVKSIGRAAFGECENLQAVGMATGLKTIDDYAFAYCSGLSSVTIPSGVTRIGDNAFEDCTGLASVSIPASVVEVGAWVFDGCNAALFDHTTFPNFLLVDGWIVGYEEDKIPQGNLVLNKGRGIAAYVFNGTGLSKVTINVAYKGIGKGAFARCTDLFAVDVKSTLNYLGDGAFYECTSLDTVSLPSNIAYMGKEAFGGCWDLKKDGFIIVNNVLYGYQADEPDTSKGKVAVPSGVTRISKGAFFGDSGLRSVVVPDSVKTIDVEAFTDCDELQRVQIGKGATDITWFDVSTDTSWCDDWFQNATGRTREPRSFCNCQELGTVEISSQNPAFMTVDDFICDKSGGTLLYCPPNMAQVQTPRNVRNIAPGAFYRSFTIQGLSFGGSVTNIGRNAFQECYNLSKVTLPTGLVSIDQYAFNWCEGLESIRIPHTVTSIGYGAFRGCTALEKVQVAETIDEDAIDLGAAFLDFDIDDIEYYKLTYKIVFHRNDGSTDTSETIEVKADETIRLTSLSKLGWARRGYDFKGWATSIAKANSGTVWKQDWGKVTNAIAIGRTLHIYAVWAVANDSYAIYFIRNDGAGTWRTIGFKHGVTTAIPTLANGFGWARRGYVFKGWSLTTADARNNKIWKADGAKVATAAAKGSVLTVYASWAVASDSYAIQFNKNDGSGKWRSVGFKHGVKTQLSSLAALGWDRSDTGYAFVGWSTNPKGSIWKSDRGVVASPVAKGKVLQVYAIWIYIGANQTAKTSEAAGKGDGDAQKCAKAKMSCRPSTSASEGISLPVRFCGVFMDGVGSYDIMLEVMDNAGMMFGHAQINTLDSMFNCECSAVTLDGRLVVSIDGGVLVHVTAEGYAEML